MKLIAAMRVRAIMSFGRSLGWGLDLAGRIGVLVLGVLLAAKAAVAADSVSKPKRMYGLGEVRRVAISADQRFLATAGQGGAFLWDVETATLTKRLEGAWTVTALAFSPDGKRLVVGTAGKIEEWDTETGTRLREFIGHQGEINRLLFSANGARLISASGDNTVRVWSTETGEETHSLRVKGSPILDVALSPDGQRLATVDTFSTNCVKLWEIESQQLIGVLPRTNWTASQSIFTPDGNLVVVAGRTVGLFNPETWEEIRSYEGITGNPLVMDVWLPGGLNLAAACSDGKVYLWNLATAELLTVVPGEPLIATTGVPNDHLTIVANVDYNVRIRQLPGGDTLRTFKGHTTSAHTGVAFSPDGRYVLSGGSEGATRLWDRQNGAAVREFVGAGGGTMAAAFSPDGSRVLTTMGQWNAAARVWKTETGEVDRELKWNGSWPMGAVFSVDGSKVGTRSQTDDIHIFDAATGNVIRTLPNGGWGGGMAFAPSAPLFAAASTDFSAELYNYETGQRLHRFTENAGMVTCVAFSPNGDTLLLGWVDGILHLYDAVTLELKREFMVRAAFLESAAFSPDGRFILTGEGWPFMTATLWDAKTAEPLRVFEGHKWTVSAVGFSADGKSVLTGAEVVREWSIADVAARLSVERLSGVVRLSWAQGKLERASEPTGPWTTLTNATSPWTLPVGEGAGFLRVKAGE